MKDVPLGKKKKEEKKKRKKKEEEEEEEEDRKRKLRNALWERQCPLVMKDTVTASGAERETRDVLKEDSFRQMSPRATTESC